MTTAEDSTKGTSGTTAADLQKAQDEEEYARLKSKYSDAKYKEAPAPIRGTQDRAPYLASWNADKEAEAEAVAKRDPYKVPVSEWAKKSETAGGPSSGKKEDNKPNLHICGWCHGHGETTESYDNFRVMTKMCPKCEGDGVVDTRTGRAWVKPKEPSSKPADADLLAKMAQIEEMIANVTSLEELERLEKALESKDIHALNAVLPVEV